MSTKRPRPREAYTVVPFEPDWPRQFELSRRQLMPALVVSAASVEHVGSTVPADLRIGGGI